MEMPEATLGTFLDHLLPDFSRQGLSLNGERLTRLLVQHVQGTACLCLPSARVTDTVLASVFQDRHFVHRAISSASRCHPFKKQDFMT